MSISYSNWLVTGGGVGAHPQYTHDLINPLPKYYHHVHKLQQLVGYRGWGGGGCSTPQYTHDLINPLPK